MGKFYVVKNGRKVGIYNTWEECKEQVYKFSGAEYKSFETLEEAKSYLYGKNNNTLIYRKGDKKETFGDCLESNENVGDCNKVIDFDNTQIIIRKFGYDFEHTDIYGLKTGDAFCDGSYNVYLKRYGFGGFIMDQNEIPFYFSGYGSEYPLKEMRNVAGEMFGAIYAIKAALQLGLKNITIHYDYEGIAKWAIGEWKTNNNFTKAYAKKINEYAKEIKIKFQKERAHKGIEGNEIADMLAKQAVQERKGFYYEQYG